MNAAPITRPPRPRILIVGGGYVGLYTALRLLKKLHDEGILDATGDTLRVKDQEGFIRLSESVGREQAEST